MLELARDRSAGAHTYHVNVEHTARAREILGPDAFLGVEHAVLFETDPDKARAAAREHLSVYLHPGSTYNIAKFRRLGYSEDDITKGINTAVTNRHNLPQPIPVFLVYQTAFADDSGIVQFRRDFYQRDNDVAQRLSRTSQVPLAERGAGNQRGG